MNEARNREMARMHVEDRMTLSEIGRWYGLSRERIRQVVRHEGVAQSVTADVAAPARRRQRVPRLGRVCEECTDSFEVLPNRAAQLFCSRRCWIVSVSYSEAELIRHLQKLATLLGRTPTRFDMNAADGPSHTVYTRHFGTLRNAQASAGLKPNGRGGAGHVKDTP